MYKALVSILGLVAFLFQTSCENSSFFKNQSSNNDERQNEDFNGKDLKDQKKPSLITVTNAQGEPIAQAKVLFGNKLNQPFLNNLLETNKQGEIAAPHDWQTPLSVTVNSPGYMRVTYYQVKPQSLNFKLHPLVNVAQIALSGKMTHFGNIKSDDIADFGLVIQALNRSDLFSFSINKLISPEFDNFKVGGFIDTSIPSNLTFPRQKENYVVPITLDKEKYRLFFQEPGLKRTYALHGQFPFKDTIDKFRNKVPFTTLINSFKFVSGGLKEFQLSGPLELDLPVNEMTFTSQETLQPPIVPANHFMMSISLFELNGMLYPTDMHKVNGSKPFALKSIDNAQKHFLSVLAIDPDAASSDTQRQEASSVEFVAQAPNHTPQFLDLIPTPTASSVLGWTSQTPTMINGVNPLITFSVLSRVITEEGKSKKIQRDWEVYAEHWVPTLELPEWPEPLTNSSIPTVRAETHRWEVVYLGTNQKLPISTKQTLGPDSADLISHVSFNSVEF